MISSTHHYSTFGAADYTSLLQQDTRFKKKIAESRTKMSYFFVPTFASYDNYPPRIFFHDINILNVLYN